ncbi:hypothetical protein BH11MYX3_BH11MYX3_28420 [soil metagenome]
MNARTTPFALLCILSISLAVPACGSDDTMNRHQVCERLASASCERLAVCEPTVARAGCETKAMARCCPDGVCDEPVIADADRLSACESSIATMSCSDLHGGDLPTSCEHLTDPVPETMPDAGSGHGPDGGPEQGDGILEINWSIYAGGTALSCTQFQNTQTVRIIATSPHGDVVTRDFNCTVLSALTAMPAGAYSVIAQARTASGQVVQQTAASTVVVSSSGSSMSFTFDVTTSFGSYCVSLANAICNTCAPSDTACKTDVVNECCNTDGVCNRPATANPQTFQSCLDAYNSGAYCSSSPPVCSGSIQVF